MIKLYFSYPLSKYKFYMEVEAVLEILRKYGFTKAESALKEEVNERNELISFDFDKSLFPIPPPVRIPANYRREESERKGDLSICSRSTFDGFPSDDDFISLISSTNEFRNPYGRSSSSQMFSDASSDDSSLPEFCTARAYPGQTEFYLYDDTDDSQLTNLYPNGPSFKAGSEASSSDSFSQFGTARACLEHDNKDQERLRSQVFRESELFVCPSEDKFIMTLETENQLENSAGLYDRSEGDSDSVRKPSLFDNDDNEVRKGCAGSGGLYYGNSVELSQLDKVMNHGVKQDIKIDLEIVSNNSSRDQIDDDDDDEEEEDEDIISVASEEPPETMSGPGDELFMNHNYEDEFEIFCLRIIHRKNRTGFEENRDMPIVLNTTVAGRYYVTQHIGSAAFSKVFQARDLQSGTDVSLKIIKNNKEFFDQSLDEIKLLKLVNKHDPADQHHILRLYDYFYHQEHLFIVCELLQANLYEFQKFNLESGSEAYFNLRRLKVISRQCLEALVYMHSLGIIHCDLKPENIMIKGYKKCKIKIIDLGSSCFRTDNLSLYVQSRSYRAPEVILGLPYDDKIDIWSLGCVLAELSSGKVLFPNDAIVMIVARMMGMLGPIDWEMLVRGQMTHKYFTKEYDLYHVIEEKDQIEYIIPQECSLKDFLKVQDSDFIDFVRALLEINPQKRLTAKEALEHPCLLNSY